MKEKKTKGEKIQKYNTEKLLKKETMQKIKEKDGQETGTHTPSKGYSKRLGPVRKSYEGKFAGKVRTKKTQGKLGLVHGKM
jgi:hypothetical protein